MSGDIGAEGLPSGQGEETKKQPEGHGSIRRSLDNARSFLQRVRKTHRPTEVTSKTETDEASTANGLRRVDIPQESTIHVPQSILDLIAAERQKSQYSSYVSDIDMATISDPTVTDAERESLAASYRLHASDKYLYFSSRTLRDPEHPQADLQILRLGYDSTNGRITEIFRDVDESIFRVAMTNFPRGTIVGRLRDVLEIEELTDRDKERYIETVTESKRLEEKLEERLRNKNEGMVTNESLDAIFAGLSPNESDRILAICGTGDVPFALALNGAHVDAVDIDPKMIEAARSQAALIEEDNFARFLSRNYPGFVAESRLRNDFFSKGVQYSKEGLSQTDLLMSGSLGRLGASEKEIWEGYGREIEADYSQSRVQTLRDNIQNITFLNEDVLRALRDGKYTKVYLSNVIGFKGQNYDFAVEVFKALADNLPSGGLFYSTLGNITSGFLEQAYKEGQLEPDMFTLDNSKTAPAAMYQQAGLRKMERTTDATYSWKTRVYQKQ